MNKALKQIDGFNKLAFAEIDEMRAAFVKKCDDLKVKLVNARMEIQDEVDREKPDRSKSDK